MGFIFRMPCRSISLYSLEAEGGYAKIIGDWQGDVPPTGATVSYRPPGERSVDSASHV